MVDAGFMQRIALVVVSSAVWRVKEQKSGRRSGGKNREGGRGVIQIFLLYRSRVQYRSPIASKTDFIFGRPVRRGPIAEWSRTSFSRSRYLVQEVRS